MQLTIELPEKEIQAFIQELAVSQVKSLANSWQTQQTIANRVKQLWDDKLDAQILKVLEDSERLEAKIVEIVEKKLLAQINSKMRQLEALKPNQAQGSLT